MVRFLLVVAGFLLLHGYGQCQVKNDTIPPGRHPKGHKDTEKPYQVDSLASRKHNPRKATLYSTFLPGLGQIYNRKYWKLPIVWAAVGIPAYTYFSNRNYYRQFVSAIALIDPYASLGIAVPDTVYNKISDPGIRSLIANSNPNSSAAQQSLRTDRNTYRKYQDYSVVFFILFWGLQIVDATVDAHLMNFDVSNELSLHLQQPSIAPGAAGGMMGIGLALDLHKPRYRSLNAIP